MYYVVSLICLSTAAPFIQNFHWRWDLFGSNIHINLLFLELGSERSRYHVHLGVFVDFSVCNSIKHFRQQCLIILTPVCDMHRMKGLERRGESVCGLIGPHLPTI